MDTLEYNGFKGSIEYSKEDGCYYGKILNAENSLILYEGDTIEKLEKGFKYMVDGHIELCKELAKEKEAKKILMLEKKSNKGKKK